MNENELLKAKVLRLQRQVLRARLAFVAVAVVLYVAVTDRQHWAVAALIATVLWAAVDIAIPVGVALRRRLAKGHGQNSA
jgi:hypothetical protein